MNKSILKILRANSMHDVDIKDLMLIAPQIAKEPDDVKARALVLDRVFDELLNQRPAFYSVMRCLGKEDYTHAGLLLNNILCSRDSSLSLLCNELRQKLMLEAV